MADTLASSLDPLILDLVEWCAREPRTHAEVLEAWRTSCPRLTVWEDATDRGLLARENGLHNERRVVVTAAGQSFLATNGRAPAD
jgi:hypothetical protein